MFITQNLEKKKQGLVFYHKLSRFQLINWIGIRHTISDKSINFYSQNIYLLNYILHGEDHFKLDCVHINKVWVGWLNLKKSKSRSVLLNFSKFMAFSPHELAPALPHTPEKKSVNIIWMTKCHIFVANLNLKILLIKFQIFCSRL